jgi:uncharacterized protein (DUF58 family)
MMDAPGYFVMNNDRVGLILAASRVERIVPPKKGDKHVMRVVREILGFEEGAAPGLGGALGRPATRPLPRAAGKPGARPLGPRTDLKGALETLASVARRRSIAFVVSDFYADGWERPLALAAAKHDVIPVVLVDPRDLELPDVGLATFEDLESGDTIVVDTGDPRVRAHHAKAMKALGAARKQVFHKLGLDAVEIGTGSSFVKPLRDLFARRARRIRR